MSVRVARSLGGYLQLVAALRRKWKVPAEDELWFRAEDQSHQTTRLQPGIYRPRDGTARKSIGKLLEIEKILYDEFGRCATQLSLSDVNSIDDDWDSYFLMQHHGAPTRLLDWSDGALIALHFAVNKKSRRPKSGSIIYVLNPYWLIDLLDEHPDRKDAEDRWNQYLEEKKPSEMDEDDWERFYLPTDVYAKKSPYRMPEIPMLWDSPHVTRRFAAQRSRFMIFGTDPLWLVKEEKKRGSQLVPITLPRSSINKIRQELKDAGITESVVYPDLDGLGRELKQEWLMRV